MKNFTFFRKNILMPALFVLLGPVSLMAQVGTPTYMNNTGNTANTIPLNMTSSNKAQWIYAPGAFTTLGGGSGTPLPPGNNITKVYIKFSATVNAANTYSNFTISLAQNVGTINNYPDVPNTSANFQTGLTQCFFQASGFAFTGITASAWYGITLQTPFPYDPSLALIVEVKTDNTAAAGNSVANVSTAGISQRKYGPYAAASGTANTGLTPVGFDVVANTPCTNPPNPPGTVTATANPVCPGVSFGLSLTGGTSGTGQTYQWQSSPDGLAPWTNMGTAASQSASQTTDTYYRCEVTCGATATTTPLLVTTNPPTSCYCAATHTNTCAGHVTNVTLNTLNNTSACNIPYITYPASGTTTTTVTKGTNYNLSVSISSNSTLSISAWFDWNINGIYEVTEHYQLAGTSTSTTPPIAAAGSTTVFSIPVPGSASAGLTGMRIRTRTSSGINGPSEACASFTAGESEEYRITVVDASACSGTPAPGNTLSTATSACPGTNITLSLQNSNLGSGITYQWQSSPTGSGYTNIGGATNSTYTTPISDMFYQCVVTCTNGGLTATSTPVQVSVAPVYSCYCTAPHSVTCTAGWITGVSYNSLNNTSACANPMIQYPPSGSTTTTVVKGNAYNLAVTISPTALSISTWIDWNRNGTYEVTEHYQLAGTSTSTTPPIASAGSTTTLSIPVPAGASSGLTGMRIRTRTSGSANGSGDACVSFASGESEEYVINIVDPIPCSGTPAPGNTLSSANPVCPGVNFTLSLQNSNLGLNITYQWQSSPDGVSYTGIGGATSATYGTSITTTTYYQCVVTCTNSGLTAASTPVQVTVNPFTACYCPATHTNTCAGHITNVTINTLNNTTVCNIPAVQYPASGSTTTNLFKGVTHNLSVSISSNSTLSISAWIDWDGSGTYDVTEHYQLAGTSASTTPPIAAASSTTVFGIPVPITAVTGQVGMRIRTRGSGSVNGSGDACTSFAGGESEDYIVNVIVPPGPLIVYTPFANTSCSANRILSATITDPQGVETSSGIAPRLYYRKSTNADVIPATNDNTTDGWKYTETTSGSSPFSFTLDYGLLFGGATPPVTIHYFVAAQDVELPPNVSIYAGSGGPTPSSVNLSPGELPMGGYFNFNLLPFISGGTVTIAGSGATYPTLTGVGGLFDAINNSSLAGNLVAEITSAAYVEPGTVALNQIAYGCASFNTLTIKPASGVNSNPICTGTNFIKLNGADNVIIDGSNNGSNSRDLTLQSASTAASSTVVWLSSLGAGLGCTDNIVKNCNIIGGVSQNTATTLTFGVVATGATATTTTDGTDNNNNTFENNAITKVRYGIYVRGSATSSNNDNVINNNLIGPASFGADEIGQGGIIIQHQNNCTVHDNEVRFVGGNFANTTGGADRIGIGVGSNLWTPTLTNITNCSIRRNNIHDIIEERIFSAAGIVGGMNAGASATNNVIANNFIYNVRSLPTSPDNGVGIGIAGGNGDKYVFNSILMTGDLDPPGTTSTITQSNMGIRISSTVPVNLTVANNVMSVDVFSNVATLKHYAIVAPASFNWGTGFCNNNDYYVNPANTHMVFGGIGITVPYAAVNTLAAWKTQFTPNQDAASANEFPVFASPTDLHLVANGNGYMESGGTPIAGVTDDIDAQVRHATTPDMGADEFAGCRLAVTAGSNSPVCENANLNLTTGTALGSGSFTYLWSGPDSFTSTNQNPVITGVSTLAAGTYTVTVTDVTLGCTISSTVTVTVNAAPVPIAGSNSPVCVGGDIQLSGGPSGMTTYAWSGPNAFASSVQNPPVISNASALHDGTYTLTVTNSLTCSATTTTDVDVVPNPVPSIASQTNVSCNGLSDGAVDIDATSGTPPYTFSDGFSPNTDGIFTGLAAGPYTITVTDDPGCSATIPVTITEPAVLDVTAGSNSPICSTSPLNLTSNPTGGTTAYSFAWSGPAGFSSTNEDPTIASPTSANSGTYTVTVTDANSCVTTTTTSVSVSDQPTTALAGPDQTVFVNSAGLAANAALSGTGTWTVITGTGTFSPNANDENATVSGLTPGLNTFRWTISNPPCTDSFDEVDITYQNCTPPTATISGNSSVCLGSSANVVLTFTGVAPWTYTISGSGGPYTATTSNNPENVSVTPTVSGSQAYTVTAISNTNCGSGTASGSATVLVSTAPPANTVSNVGGTTGACNGDVVLMTSNVITGQNIKYSWNTGSNSSVVKFSTAIGGPFVNGPFETTANSVYAQFGALAGGSSGYNICVQGTNGCGSTNNKCTWIRGIVSPPAAITGSAIQCSGATGQAYSSAAVPSATIYTWSFSVPGAVFAGQGTQNVSVDFPAFSSGNLCVTAALSCGGSSTSAPKCMAISNATANPGVMTGPNKICPGQTGVVYSIPAIAGAGTYNWTVPAGATITANTGPSITVSWPNPYTLNQSVCVTATSVCGAISAARCKSVSSGIPSTPGTISGQAAGVCGQTIVYSVVPVAGGTSYTWVVPAGGTINSGQGTNSINVTWGLVTTLQISVTANSACGSSGPRTLNIAGAPATPGTISQLPAVVCNGGPANFSITAVAGATGYTWTVPANGSVIDNGQGTTSIDVTWGTGTGTVTVKANNACGVSPSTSNKLVTPGCKMASGSVSVMGTEMNLAAYPNPAHDKLVVEVSSDKNTGCTIKMIDIAGRAVIQNEHKLTKGVNTSEIDVSNLPAGIYLLELVNEQRNERIKVVKE